MKLKMMLPAPLLVALFSSAVMAEGGNTDLVKQLAAEASGSDVIKTGTEKELEVSDAGALMEQITKDLESYLKVAPEQPLTKSAVVEVAEKAQAQGNTADEISKAVAAALDALAGKGIQFEPGTQAFIQASMRDMLNSNVDLAAGDPASAYIQSLNSELADTEVTQFGSQPAAAKATTAPRATYSMNSQRGPKGTITVVAGESLSNIAHRVYGDAALYPIIFEANRDVMNSPNVVFEGQVLRIPPMTSATAIIAPAEEAK